MRDAHAVPAHPTRRYAPLQVTLLVPDKAAADAASKVAGVAKVLVADSESLRRGIAEPYAGLVVALQKKHGERAVGLGVGSGGVAG